MRTVRHDLLYFYGASDRHEDVKRERFSRAATTSDRIMRLPYSYSPSVQP